MPKSFPLFIKFLFVGVINTLFGYSLFAFLMFIGLHYTLAVILGTIIALIFNFKTTGTFVFNNKNNKLLLRFIIVYCFTTVLSIIGLRICELHNFNLYWAGLFLTGVMAVITFVLQKFYVFRKEGI